MNVDQQTLADLIDERLPRSMVRAIQSGYKGPGRFDVYLSVLQDRVPWSDRILMPFGDNLFVVVKPDGRRLVKCRCGHEFCPPDQNWKLDALIHVRDSEEALLEIFPRMMHGDPEWQEIREYFCPGCHAQLEVEAVPPGYPIVHDFVPDIDGFYEEWLGRRPPPS
ncbi:MAG TPA: acetone carboxylase subunit gamma [Solirubrobacteraceae bacterium]|nr:acetone carboxylase subunit gamma [Solirubrobacteraceae bacterium]